MSKNVNPAQMAKINQSIAKAMDPRVLQQLGKSNKPQFGQFCQFDVNYERMQYSGALL